MFSPRSSLRLAQKKRHCLKHPPPHIRLFISGGRVCGCGCVVSVCVPHASEEECPPPPQEQDGKLPPPVSLPTSPN